MGIDVKKSRKCAYLVFNKKGRGFSSGWLEGESNSEICKNLIKIINEISFVAIGIDVPEFHFQRQESFILRIIGEPEEKENPVLVGIVKLS